MSRFGLGPGTAHGRAHASAHGSAHGTGTLLTWRVLMVVCQLMVDSNGTGYWNFVLRTLCTSLCAVDTVSLCEMHMAEVC